MTRSFRILLAAFVAASALAGAPVQGQSGPATITFNDPNCGSWGMTQSGSSFTLTCQSLTCTIGAVPSNPLPGDGVQLTANCGSASATYAWSKTAGSSSCSAIPSSGNPVSLPAPANNATVVGCSYKVVVADGANGSGQANITLNWSSGPPPAPTGCVASISTNPSPLANAGGTATVSVTGCSPAGVTYSWSKNGAPSWSTSASPAADTLGSGGTAGYTNSYQVNVCNGSTCINVPAGNPLTAFVPGTGSGSGSNIDLSACTAAGYTGHGVDIAYPLLANSPRLLTPTVGSFGNYDMIVVRFVAPASEATPGATITAAEYSAFEAVQRLVTLSTQPCAVATSQGDTSQGILATTANFPTANLKVAVTTKAGYTKLTPGATYYVNYLNRLGYTPSPSCSSSNCAMYVDFKN